MIRLYAQDPVALVAIRNFGYFLPTADLTKRFHKFIGDLRG
jgi:hypothetical protein